MKKLRFFLLTYCHLIRSDATVTVSVCGWEYKPDNSTCFTRRPLWGLEEIWRVKTMKNEAVFFYLAQTPNGFSKKEATAHSSCSLFLLWVICVSTLLIPRGCCCWPMGSWERFFSKGWEQMKWWDSCNFWMTPSWQRQCPSIVLSHYSLLLCHGAFCSFCCSLCPTPCLQVRP